MNLSTKQKQTPRQRDQTCACQGRGEKEESWSGNLGINTKVLRYTTGSYIQSPGIIHSGKECFKKRM